MIQDKIFFDEKDPTGVSYNTPFTVYGSYEGRLWSKTPTGSIKFYTQNSDLSVYATTGSNQFEGAQDVTGSLTVTGGITGSVTTASYVEYTGVANKPALVSGSEQVSFNGIVDKPTLVSGSSQITYSGISSIPAGIVSSSAQVGGYGIFATTGSNQFNGSQSITGSLTVTGQVVAQTLNVQQVTSSIVYSSGSNVFGNSLANTQQFTGSLQVSGSSHNILGNVGIGPTGTPVSELQVGKSSDVTIAMSNSSSVTSGNRGSLAWYNSSNSTVANIKATAVTDNVGTQLEFYTRPAAGSLTQVLTLASTGAATFNTGTQTTSISMLSTGTASGLRLQNTGGTASDWIIQSDGGAVAGQAALRFYSITATAYRMSIDGSGNVGIGTTSPSSRLNIAGAKTNSVDLTNAANQLAITDTTATAAGVGGRISFLGSYTATPDYITFGAIEVLKDNANNYGSASWNNAAMRFIVGNNNNDANAGRMLERMRITSGGNVGIGVTNPATSTKLMVAGGIGFGNNTDGTANLSYGGRISAKSTSVTGGGGATLIHRGLGSVGYFILVSGLHSSNRFMDLIYGTGANTPIVLASNTENTAPTRTYSISGENIFVSLTDNSAVWTVITTGLGAMEA